MDIHKPKAPHSLREFALEIGTITIGILIALGLEAGIESWRGHQLADHARADLLNEMTSNRDNLKGALESARGAGEAAKPLIAWGWSRLKSPDKVGPPHVDLRSTFTLLSTAAWESTVASGALTHMPYAQTQALSRAYSATRGFNVLEQRVEDEWFQLATFQNLEDLEPNQLRDGLGRLSVSIAYQNSIVESSADLIKALDDGIAAVSAGGHASGS
jgi:hypothetical protein